MKSLNGTWDRWYSRLTALGLVLFLAFLVYRDLDADGNLDSELLLIALVAAASGTSGALVRRILGGTDDGK